MSGSSRFIADLSALYPALALIGASGLILLVMPFLRRCGGNNGSATLSGLGVLAALALLIRLPGEGFGATLFAETLVTDSLSTASAFVLLLSGLLAVLIAQSYLKAREIDEPEYYAILLLSMAGAYLMLLANDLLILFLGLELMSFGFYAMAGFARRDGRSGEAALKYFLTGAFASALFLYGIMLIYGVSASTEFAKIQSAVAHGALHTPMGLAGMILIIAGLGFKVAAVPFHQWAPDVYEGAPTSATAFLAATAKIGAFVGLIRVLDVFAGGSQTLIPMLRVLAIATMIYGNLVAIAQTNVKRMLGYSAVAHAGYLLAAMVCVAMHYEGTAGARTNTAAMSASVFYLLAYALAGFGAFGVLAYLSSRDKDVQTLDDLRGLVQRDAPSGYALILFMLSLAGIPATVGFIGKWQIFYAVLIGGDMTLAVTIALTSAMGAYYYLRVVWYAAFESASGPDAPRQVGLTGAGLTVFVSAFATLLLGIVPGLLTGFLQVVK